MKAPVESAHQDDCFKTGGFSSKLRIAAMLLGTLPATLGLTGCGSDVQRSSMAPEADSNIDRIAALEQASHEIRQIAETGKSVSVTDKVITSSGARVGTNRTEWYGHGFIIGSPINSGDTGFIWSTYELHINQGYFPDDLSYIGSDIHLSIDGRNTEIFQDFQRVEKQNHQHFVFEYVRKHPLNPEIEDSNLFLQNVYTVDQFLTRMNVSTLPLGVTAKNPWSGSQGTKTKVGRIVDIERYGQLGDFAVLEVNMSGLAAKGGEKLVKLTIVDEDIAKWCEKAIALGRDVEIDVAEDVVEVWEPSGMIVNGIRFKDTTVKAESSEKAQYETWRDRLLKDPVFIEAMKNAVK